MHEAHDTAGAAHFLEHVTFQGTEGLPTEEHIHKYSEEKGLYHNAQTTQTNTSYIVDGYDIESVGYLVTQVALSPTLERETLEKERNPVIDELRGRASQPNFQANVAHARAIRGDRYSRPVIGSVEDIVKMTHENLTAYHERNYKLGNAVLVICSSEPVDRQRKYTESLLDSLKPSGSPEPTELNLPNFNPGKVESSLQLVDLPTTAQTSLGINYALPEVKGLDERFSHNMLATGLAKAAHRRLRSELALCYGAQVGTTRLDNLQFGANQNWAHLQIFANLNGEDSIPALDAMLDDVLLSDLPARTFESVVRDWRRSVDHSLQDNPAGIANFIRDVLTQTQQETIDLEVGMAFANRISIDALRKLQKEITETSPLVTATSPDPIVLEKIGEWATSRIRN